MHSRAVRFRSVALILSVIVVIAVLVFNYADYRVSQKVPTDFLSCISLGYPVLESYPRRCTVHGDVFIEDIGTILAKDNLIRVLSPLPNTKISSPLVIAGMARGTWFFEGSFPVELSFGTTTPSVVVVATAGAPWMTEEFVPFTATLTFDDSIERSAIITFKKDNPSGLPEHDDELSFNVIISPSEKEAVTVPDDSLRDNRKECVITGCSGQICAEEKTITTCEYIPQYGCYRGATCARQADGRCGWTQTPSLTQCLSAGGIIE